MKNIISKSLLIALALIGVCTTGCKSIPSTDTMYNTSYAVGVATGMIANETKIDDATRNAVVEVIDIVSQCVPETNQTFEAAWTPIAEAHVAKLVADGKLDEAQAKLVMAAFNLAVKGLDYVFEVRYPKAKVYKELVVSAIDGFSMGFLTVFKPVNPALGSAAESKCDVESYDWLKANAVK